MASAEDGEVAGRSLTSRERHGVIEVGAGSVGRAPTAREAAGDVTGANVPLEGR